MPQPNFQSAPPPKFKIVPPGGGETTSVFSDQNRILLSSQDTNGQFIVCDCEAPPGSESPLHVHSREDEVLFVQSGCYEFHIDGESIEVGPGSVVYCPRDVPHSFSLVGQQSGRALTLIWPGGCENYFRRCTNEFATGAPDFRKIVQISNEFGITLLAPEGIEAHRAMRTVGQKPLVVPSRLGETWMAGDTRIRQLLSPLNTGGNCSLIECLTPCGTEFSLPSGTQQNAMLFVHEGSYELNVGSDRVEVDAGTLIYAPNKEVSTVRVTGDAGGQLLVFAFLGNGQEEEFSPVPR